MPSNLTDQQKKQAALYICNAMSVTVKRGFEVELKTNSELAEYVKELKSTIETTRQISTLKPSDELLQGSRNLLRGQIDTIQSKKTPGLAITSIFSKIKNSAIAIGKTRQPIWAVATYLIIGLIAGRLLLSPDGNKPIDINGQASLDMDKLISSELCQKFNSIILRLHHHLSS